MRVNGRRVEEIQAERRFNSFVDGALERLDPKTTAAGVLRQIREQGPSSLTENQEYYWEQVLDQYAPERCERCREPLTWDEKLDAYDRGGLCVGCDLKVSP